MSKVDVNFVKPFVDGTKEALSTLCGFSLVPGKPFLKKLGDPSPGIDIAGIIGLTSTSFKGAISIGFPEAVFLKIMSKMLGEEYSTITPEIEDGAAELMNIIFGHAKSTLNSNGYDLEKAIPSIARGGSLTLRSLTKSDVVIIPFEIEVGQFFMEVAIEDNT